MAGSQKKTVKRFDFILKSGSVAVANDLAVIDISDNAVIPAATTTDAVPIGFFAESKTGDGVVRVTVELFEEITLYKMLNDAASVTLIGSTVYTKTGTSVTTVSAGASVAGKCWIIESDGVWIRFAS